MQPIALAQAPKHEGPMSDEAWEMLQQNQLVRNYKDEPFLRSMMSGKGGYEYPVEKMEEPVKRFGYSHYDK